MNGRLILEDGSVFSGESLVPGSRFAEVVFNTSMTGYQEILTDPSYRGQIVIMTQPHIGNYGAYDDAAESHRIWVEGFVAREFTGRRSGCGDVDLGDYLEAAGVPTLGGIDTRAAVRRLRDRGAMRGLITTCDGADVDLIEEVRRQPTMEGRALVDEVTCDAPWHLEPEGEERFRLAVYDFGVKRNILRSLVRQGARGDRAAGAHSGRGVPGAWRRRRGAVERSRRSRAPGRDRRPGASAGRGRRAVVRHLPGAPTPGTRSRGKDLQAESSAITAAISRSATRRQARCRSPARITVSP